MVDIKNLWTGDYIRQISTGTIGVYEGAYQSKLKIKIREGHVMIDVNDAEVIDEKEVEEIRAKTSYNHSSSTNIIKRTPPKKIDLHLEKLDPEGRITSHARMLDFQLKACAEYLEKAHYYGHKVVTVIHGQGLGILKREVRFLISGLDYVQFSNPINQDGATEVWFKY